MVSICRDYPGGESLCVSVDKNRGRGRPVLETHPVKGDSEVSGLCSEKHLRPLHK